MEADLVQSAHSPTMQALAFPDAFEFSESQIYASPSPAVQRLEKSSIDFRPMRNSPMAGSTAKSYVRHVLQNGS